MIRKILLFIKRERAQDTASPQSLLNLALKTAKYLFNIKKIRRVLSKNSIFSLEEELSMCSLFPKKTLDKIIEFFDPKSVLDLRCGTGKSLDYFLSKKIDVFGVEGSELAISRARHSKLIMRYNLNNELDLGRKFDLLWSFEFVEHIHPSYVENMMKTFSNHSDIIVISTARPGQGGRVILTNNLPSIGSINLASTDTS